MDILEARLRKMILKTMMIIIVLDMVLNIALFSFYYANDLLIYTVPVYVVRRIILPIAINFLAYIVARHYNDSQKESRENKYWACSLAFITIIGCLAISHSYFVVLWICPAFAMIFCGLFHDFKLIRVMFICSMLIIAVAYAVSMAERSERLVELVQNVIVAALIVIIAFLLANVMEDYTRVLKKQEKQSMENEIKLKRKLDYDPLTEVHSRGYMEVRANEILMEASRFNPVTVALIDVDAFKEINDKYGHEAGDKVLKTLGLLFNSIIDERKIIVGRYGGEEFLFVFNGGSIGEHFALLDALRESFSLIDFSFMGPVNNRSSFSGGMTTAYDKSSLEELFKIADEALYEAKAKGKNNIVRK